MKTNRVQNPEFYFFGIFLLLSCGGFLVHSREFKPLESRSATIEISKCKTGVTTEKTAPRLKEGSLIVYKFQIFSDLSKKAIPTQEDLKTLRDEISDPQLIEESRQILLGKGEREWSMSAQENRMHRVDFLTQALNWKENPAFSDAMEAATEIVSRDVQALSLPLLLKKSFAGDQIELYQALSKAEPAAALRIQDRSKGTPNQKLIAFAIAYQKRDEP